MRDIIEKNSLYRRDKLIKYIADEFNAYQTNRYPLNTLVVLDDFANNKLLIDRKSILHQYFSKCRHHNITYILAVQTVKFVPRNDKRMLTDIVLYGGLSEDDFFNLMKEIPMGIDYKRLYEEYKENITKPHAKLIINTSAANYKFDFD